MVKEFWDRNARSRLAEKAEMTSQHLSDILHRRRGVGKEKAKLLEVASGSVGQIVRWEEWLFNTSSTHPAFFGDPK